MVTNSAHERQPDHTTVRKADLPETDPDLPKPRPVELHRANRYTGDPMSTSTDRPYEPIEPQPRDPIFSRQPETESLLAAYQSELQELQNHPKAIRQMERLQKHEDRNFSIVNEEMENQFQLTEETRNLHINQGVENTSDIEFIYCGPELDPKGEAGFESRKAILQALKDETQAIQAARRDARSGIPLTEYWIRNTHRLLTHHQKWVRTTKEDRLSPLHPGEYKRRPNRVRLHDGTTQWYAPPSQVRTEVERLLQMHKDNMEHGTPPEVEGAWMMRQLKHIHPFQDGNSRTSRVLMNFILMRNGLPGLALHPGNDKAFLNHAMYEAMQKKNWNPLIRFIRQQVHNQLEIKTQQMRDAVRGQAIITPSGNGITPEGAIQGPTAHTPARRPIRRRQDTGMGR